VALAAAQQPIDFVRIIPYVGVIRPEDALVADAGPPLNTGSSVEVIGRETMAPPPTAPTALPVGATPPSDAAQQRQRREPQLRPRTPPDPAEVARLPPLEAEPLPAPTGPQE
jgi:hypothetical protein